MTAASDVLLFQVGPRVFASVVHDAVRIGSPRDVEAGELLVETALGLPFSRDRGIVVATQDARGSPADRMMIVDQVVGIRAVAEEDLLPLPPFAAACLSSGAVIGFVVLDDAPTLLVDLPTLVREQLAEIAAVS